MEPHGRCSLRTLCPLPPMGWASHLNYVFCKKKPNTIPFNQCVPLHLLVLLCFFLERSHSSFSSEFLFFFGKTDFFLLLPHVSQLHCCQVHKSFTFHQIYSSEGHFCSGLIMRTGFAQQNPLYVKYILGIATKGFGVSKKV